MPGTMHQYNGREAVGRSVYGPADKRISSPARTGGMDTRWPKGSDLKWRNGRDVCKETGLCRGMGGSMHIADFAIGMLGANGIVGEVCPIATGAALASQIRGTDQVAVTFMGDAAANEGSFHESINVAAVWKLPVVFVIENNLYGYSVKSRDAFPTEHIAPRAAGIRNPGEIVDGQDVLSAMYKLRPEPWSVHGAARDPA